MLQAGAFGSPGSHYHGGSILKAFKIRFNTEKKLCLFLMHMSQVRNMVGVTGSKEFRQGGKF